MSRRQMSAVDPLNAVLSLSRSCPQPTLWFYRCLEAILRLFILERLCLQRYAEVSKLISTVMHSLLVVISVST